MILTQQNLCELKDRAVQAAQKASEVISVYKNTDLRVDIKDGAVSKASQVVTKADRHAEKVIIDELKPISLKFGIDFLAEESFDEKKIFNTEYIWLIDPLDGTLPFIEKTSGYAVSIALINRAGQSLIGVVSDPVEKKLYCAVKGAGVFINNYPWKRELNDDKQLIVYADRSFKNSYYYDASINFIENYSNENDFTGFKVKVGQGAVMNALSVLKHHTSCYFKFPKKDAGGGCLWDYAATNCIFQEAGLFSSDIYGNFLNLSPVNRSVYMNEKGVIYASTKNIMHALINFYQTL